jgi:hypothetical protein
MKSATTELVDGVTLEAISAPDLPDTESLLGELGAMYPVVTYPATDVAEDVEAGDPAEVTEQRREELDASIMTGLLWP